MPQTARVPPGRAGRLWLQRRLVTARRGADLLEHKLRILRVERQRLELLEQHAEAAWDEAAGEADRWGIRAALLGGRLAFQPATRPARPAEVAVEWSYLMGVRYPASTACTLPPPDPEAVPGSSALAVAAERYRAALEAAVRLAAATEAVRVVEAEVAATGRRVRAIEERWIPMLEGSLGALRIELDEAENAEGLRMRWAAGRVGPETSAAKGVRPGRPGGRRDGRADVPENGTGGS